MANLGMVGLGLMGSRIALRLLNAGHQVCGYNRTQAKAESLINAGMQWKNTPREVAQAAEITLSMVTDTAALSLIANGPDGILVGLSSGKIYVDMSTVSPSLIRDLAGRVAASGAQMLEAPVSGSVPAIESGTLVPLDKQTLIESVKKTSCAIVIDEGYEQYGVTAELASVIADSAFYYLDAPVKRMGAMNVPIPFSPALEDLTIPNAKGVFEMAKSLCNKNN